jgi:hypothetical protein
VLSFVRPLTDPVFVPVFLAHWFSLYYPWTSQIETRSQFSHYFSHCQPQKGLLLVNSIYGASQVAYNPSRLLHRGRIEEATITAIIEHTSGKKLQVDFGKVITALIDTWQEVE